VFEKDFMQDFDINILLIATAAGLSVMFMAYFVIGLLSQAHAEAVNDRSQGRKATSLLFRIARPMSRATGFFVAMLSARIEMAVGRGAERSFLLPARIWAERKLRAAAHPQGVTADEFLGMIALGAVVATFFGIVVNTRLGFGPIILVFSGMGAYTPILWLRGQINRRQDDIRRGLPYALDLLTLSVEAGLDFTQALARIVQKLGPTPLALELGGALRDIQLGRTRAQALRELSRRVDLSELNSIVSSLIQADELGSSLGPILRVQSEQLRQRRSQDAEKKAMEAPVKILFPLVLFIFPTIFIIIFGPIAIKYIAK
jgi:tight adherence protein C